MRADLQIDPTGHVATAHLVNFDEASLFGLAVLAALRQWTFEPATVSGRPVETTHHVVFQFNPK